MPQNKDQGTGRFVQVPSIMDILCGKTKECTVHEGTKRFRATIESYRTAYAQALTKFDKMTVTLTIYDLLTKSSSRFLKWNESMGAWEELSLLAARDKVGHALRFANRAKRREYPGQEKALSLPVSTSQGSSQSSSVMAPLTLNNAMSFHAQADIPSLPPAADVVSVRIQQQGTDANSRSMNLMAVTVKLASDTVALLNSVTRASSSESITSLDTDCTPTESDPPCDTNMDLLEPLEVGNMHVNMNDEPGLDDLFPWDNSLDAVFA